MDTHIEEKFEKMGARVTIGELTPNRIVNDPNRLNATVLVNVINDNKGQIFDIRTRGKVDLTITDLRPDDRHLVLLAKIFQENEFLEPDKIKFLCGHDEREWFSCQLNDASVTTVDTAKLSLRPDAVKKIHRKKNIKQADRIKRKNEGSIRQGEWFFVPVDMEDPDMNIVLRNEPLMVSNVRGGSKPHIAQFAFRDGGETVYVPRLPVQMMLDNNIDRERLSAGLTEKEKKQYIQQNPESKRWNWSLQVRNPKLYVKGNIRHPDHATLKLRQWHEVYMNREVRGRFNVFLD